MEGVTADSASNTTMSLSSLVALLIVAFCTFHSSTQAAPAHNIGAAASSSDKDAYAPLETILQDLDRYRLQEQEDLENEVKRSEFSPWGGKRAFQPWGGKRNQGELLDDDEIEKRLLTDPSMEYGGAYIKKGFQPWGGKRASFQPWGGKRSSLMDTDEEVDDELLAKRTLLQDEQDAGYKRGFQPWGGKRAFNPWGGKRAFNPWGGKRAFSPWGGKRAFNPWGGKRAFQPWGGKRSVDAVMNAAENTSEDQSRMST